MNSDPELTGPSTQLAVDLARALVFALVWSFEVAARFAEPSMWGRLSLLVATLGSTALTLGAVGIVTGRRVTTGARPLRPIVAALIASGPAALFARVLQNKTHHRALGGVTFALVAGALVFGAALVVGRLLGPPAAQAPPRPVLPRFVVTIIVVTSIWAAIAPLVHEFGPGGSPSGRWLAQDLAVGATLSGLVALLPRATVPSRVAFFGAVAWAVFAGAGAVLVALSMPLRAILSEHAPVALGFIGGL
jgi:hypothetical protein